MRLTLRTLLAYLDDTLPAAESKLIGQKLAESSAAKELVERVKRLPRRRGLSTPMADGSMSADPNTVAEYLSDALSSDQLSEFEQACLSSDVNLAEVSACHQILTLLLAEPVRVPPTARQRMYRLVTGPEALPNKKPGNTIPVGGMMPDEPLPTADDTDAAYLLGLPAFRQTESKGRRLGQLGLLVGVLAALATAVYLAWPQSPPADGYPLPRVVTLAPTAPEPRPFKPEGEGKPETKQTEPATKPGSPLADPVTPPTTGEPKPMPVDLIPAPQPPKPDRLGIGTLESTDKVLVSERNGKWVRLMAKDPIVYTSERLISLPGYKSDVRLDSGLRVLLWGNLPDQVPIAVLESSLIFHLPADGFDADLTLLTGRVFLGTTRKNTRVRLRIRDEIWDVTLPEDKADVVVEVTHSLVRGVSREVDLTEKPETSIALAVLKGSAKLAVRYKEVPELKEKEALYWSSKGVGLQGPRPLVNQKPFRDAAYYNRYPLSPNEQAAKAVTATLTELAGNYQDPESLRIRLAEFMAIKAIGPDETRSELLRTHVMRPRVAVLGYAAVGDLPELVDALHDESRSGVREAAVYGLTELAATVPTALTRFAETLKDRYRLTDDQIKMANSLLRGMTDEERKNPALLDAAVEQLQSPSVAIRELAYWVLLNDVDPEARSVKGLNAFDATGAAAERDAIIKQWKRRIEDVKRKLSESKP